MPESTLRTEVDRVLSALSTDTSASDELRVVFDALRLLQERVGELRERALAEKGRQELLIRAMPPDRIELRDFEPAPTQFLISSATRMTYGGLDHVRLWNRGSLCGDLTMQLGDGAQLLEKLGLADTDSTTR